MGFPCTKCGLCCKNIKNIEDLDDFHNGDGVCFFYTPEFGCEIYKTRPYVCRIDEGYHIFDHGLTLEEYYKKNMMVCNDMQNKIGFDFKYRVKIK